MGHSLWALCKILGACGLQEFVFILLDDDTKQAGGLIHQQDFDCFLLAYKPL
jgi:hypothetical protein